MGSITAQRPGYAQLNSQFPMIMAPISGVNTWKGLLRLYPLPSMHHLSYSIIHSPANHMNLACVGQPSASHDRITPHSSDYITSPIPMDQRQLHSVSRCTTIRVLNHRICPSHSSPLAITVKDTHLLPPSRRKTQDERTYQTNRGDT